MGPLAGLAAGLGLAALASHLGFGEELASMMMIGLLVMAVLVVVGMVMRRRAAAQRPALAGAGMQYAGMDPNASARPFEPAPNAAPSPALSPAQEAAWTPASAPAAAATPGMVGSGHIPADFDVASFERTAKVQFIRLQAANDAGNLDDIRAFTTPEMFAELKMNLSDRGAAAQQTEVLDIDARVLDVEEEAARYVVSVRFSGQIREDGAAAETIDEIWHLVKPRYGNEGWRLAGIQQAQ
jgi:predicted lipid-binding transport protein (Tim44 family)